MTTQQKIEELRKQFLRLKSGEAVQIAAQDTHVKMSARIFEKGKNANDGDIGKYDTSNPLYVNPDDSPKKFPTTGKPKANGKGASKFEDGTKHKTGYFESYAAFRKKIGRKTDKVNLVLSGDLQSDFGKAVMKVGPNKFASTVRQNNQDKIDGMNLKYGPIFRLTPKERTNFKQVLAFETFKLLNSA